MAQKFQQEANDSAVCGLGERQIAAVAHIVDIVPTRVTGASDAPARGALRVALAEALTKAISAVKGTSVEARWLAVGY